MGPDALPAPNKAAVRRAEQEDLNKPLRYQVGISGWQTWRVHNLRVVLLWSWGRRFAGPVSQHLTQPARALTGVRTCVPAAAAAAPLVLCLRLSLLLRLRLLSLVLAPPSSLAGCLHAQQDWQSGVRQALQHLCATRKLLRQQCGLCRPHQLGPTGAVFWDLCLCLCELISFFGICWSCIFLCVLDCGDHGPQICGQQHVLHNPRHHSGAGLGPLPTASTAASEHASSSRLHPPLQQLLCHVLCLMSHADSSGRSCGAACCFFLCV